MSDLSQTALIEESIAVKQNLALVKLLTAIMNGKRAILLAGLILALCAGLFEWWCQRDRFTASTEIVPPQTVRAGAANSLLSQLGTGSEIASLGGFSSALQAKTQTDTFVVILGAWPIRDALVKRFNLMSVYHDSTPELARSHLDLQTSIKGSKEGFITISVTDFDRKRSADIANAYVDELRNFMRKLALTESSQRRLFYEVQLTKTKEDLAQAETNFKQMQQSSRMISLDSQARTALEGAASLRAQITSREVELQELRSYSTESNPQVQIAETELSALRGQLAQMESKSGGGYSGAGLSSVPGAELDFVRATRELKYQEGLYDLMVKQYEGASIDEAKDAPVVQVIEPALPPEKKSGPRRPIITLLAFVVGMFAGLVLVVYRFWRSQLDAADSARLVELRKAALRW
jgi:tyrosine-protein kinase Etk/Wzc